MDADLELWTEAADKVRLQYERIKKLTEENEALRAQVHSLQRLWDEDKVRLASAKMQIEVLESERNH